MSSIEQQVPSPKVMKKIVKEIAKEEKEEESRIRELLDDLAKSEKERTKADKAVTRAEAALAKAEKKEVKAIEAANKATHERDIAGANRYHAEQKELLKREIDSKLLLEIHDKKQKAEEALRDQKTHNIAREAKLAGLLGKDTDSDQAKASDIVV
ncbi:hypothetical protein C0991_008182 [Blastosporella zonata]|nr:hypothetical protein C0991_008182 [Blastosporella zonata]